MDRKSLKFIIPVFAAVLAGCSLFAPREATVDYHTLELTAIVHITQTFEALPTATATFTPVPTNTPEPTATEPYAESEDFMISRPDQVFPVEDEVILLTRPTDRATEIPPEPTATVYFPDKADFVAALPSPNQFIPGQHFYLTWQIKNVGTSTWSGKYRFYHSSGIQLADEANYTITDIVEPGGTLTITMPATSPETEGSYSTVWTLENPDGIPFYYLNFVAIVGDRTFITAVPELNPTATPSSLEWMCSDPERSRIQGDGCVDFCLTSSASVDNCYINGENVSNGE